MKFNDQNVIEIAIFKMDCISFENEYFEKIQRTNTRKVVCSLYSL